MAQFAQLAAYATELRDDGTACSRRAANGLREATVEDVRTALENVTDAVGKATREQYILRTKSLLGYAHKVGYTPFNAGAVIKIKPDSAHRGATLAKRIVSKVEVSP